MKPESVLIVCLSVFAVILTIVQLNNLHEMSRLRDRVQSLEEDTGDNVDEARVQEIVEEMVQDRCLE